MSGSVIQRERERKGVGVRTLARRMGVSPATIQNYERSDAEGRIQLDTLRRVMKALGAPIRIHVASSDAGSLLRREERVALELHKAVAAHLLRDPDRTLENVAGIAAAAKHRVDPYTAGLLDEWVQLAAERDLAGLLHVMTSTDARSIDMRQVGPFNGVLTPAERLEAIARAR